MEEVDTLNYAAVCFLWLQKIIFLMMLYITQIFLYTYET